MKGCIDRLFGAVGVSCGTEFTGTKCSVLHLTRTLREAPCCQQQRLVVDILI
jgi:hypothetical protein